ncbi:MAG: metal ABC transporter ATP-binding protein [Gemmataceae bacterium]|jgi:zinc transport system ATP-binding protein|nr:metal ABC transporter ATP-binding protein [Gemmataceae bacterium]
MKPLATIKNLSVSLGGRSILRGIDCELQRGKITALIGLNGAGKSTLLKALIREVPYQGAIEFHCGHDHSSHRPDHVGYVPQRLVLDERMPLTVLEFFALTLQRWPLFLGISQKVRERSQLMLSRVGAIHLLHRPVAKLSGGETQRVLLALALEPKPELLLLDEPAAGIDFVDQKPFYDLIAEINRQANITILLVSHELSVVSEVAHHVLCLNNGKIQCQGTPSEVLTDEAIKNTFGSGKRLYNHFHDGGAGCSDPSHSHGFWGHSHGW